MKKQGNDAGILRGMALGLLAFSIVRGVTLATHWPQQATRGFIVIGLCCALALFCEIESRKRRKAPPPVDKVSDA